MTSTAFLTDMYEITMLQAALQDGTAHKKAVFELFARKLPDGRRYGVVMGMDRAINAVQNFTFTSDQLDYIRQNYPLINEQTLDYLKEYKFNGTLLGYQEGDVYFPHSPILTVFGTFGEAVLLETVLLSIMNHDSAVASAASRMVLASQGLPIIEMGSRRTHESAAVASARAAYLVGFKATSNMEAAHRFGVPATGTSAHAFSLAYHDEEDAFRQQVKALGTSTTLLVDTYDTHQGIINAIDVAGTELGGIRIDSGDLYEETVKARALLDSLGAFHTKIILSSDMDEFVIQDLLDRGAPVDGVGAGTRVVTGSGHPTASMVYKLVSIENAPTSEFDAMEAPHMDGAYVMDRNMRRVAKKATGKKSLGGLKLPFRTYNSEGEMTGEHFTRFNDFGEDSNLVNEVMKMKDGLFRVQLSNGIAPLTDRESNRNDQIRKHHAQVMSHLPDEAKLVTAGSPAFVAQCLDLHDTEK